MKSSARLYTILILIALGAIFIVQNTTVVEVRLLFWSVLLSRALLIVFLLIIGFALGWLMRGHFTSRNNR